MEQDTEETVIRPPRRAAVDSHVDSADTILLTRMRTGATSPSRPSSPAVSEPPAVAVAPAPAPLHYRFAVNSHTPIDLDRPAHIGRRPSLPRVPQRVRPRLVRVPSPLQEVSATHLEVRQEGASVVVTDLRSTNGTIVAVPGSRPRALRPGESLVVTPGTVIDIGDGNRVEILPLRRGAGESTPSEGAAL
ncbi:FHA domain-containing protein [Salinibacterium sp. SYSU T00001]|uniref:FHA domain-containing protein n=1 Tax=Homoserinimonas sedimenticola TaxID=2986805 RepID=UPI002236321D|nr:FHA domain-containing protein [Salinibacterium sedimenticola]MCW4386684.1 FHA domain-containing protein [Salinibacterium sedimenticola]